MSVRTFLLLILFLIFPHLILPCAAQEEKEYTATIRRYPYHLKNLSVIGEPVWHDIQPKETLLDIARDYGLGYNELELLYPQLDPWIPPPGQRITIPTFWVIPPNQHEQLVINVPELRLYFFDKKTSQIQTNPIGIGDEGWETPLGIFHITEKRPNPSWYIPQSLQAKYGMAVMPPGPENPLGEFVMKFSAGAYGIHGTHMPWGVGRLVSHGCIRCYPEHIRILYPQVPVGTKLEIIYEPIKFGQKDDQIFVEVHPDVYNKISDFEKYATNKLRQFPAADLVDEERFRVAVNLQNGIPTNVSLAISEEYAQDQSQQILQPQGESVSKGKAPASLQEETTPLVEETTPSMEEETVSPPQEEIIVLPEEETTAPLPAASGGGEFTLQITSLRNKENAYQLSKDLQAKGYPSRTEAVDLGTTGTWYRVMVGDFATREEAMEFADQFQQREQLQGLVVRKSQ